MASPGQFAAAHAWLDRVALALADYLPFTGSCDVRHDANYLTGDSDKKIGALNLCVVDANRFPAGFNHVETDDTHDDWQRAVEILLRKKKVDFRRVHVVTEAHTRMRGYSDSVQAMKGMLRRAFADADSMAVTSGTIRETVREFCEGGEHSELVKSTWFILNADLSPGQAEKEEGEKTKEDKLNNLDVEAEAKLANSAEILGGPESEQVEGLENDTSNDIEKLQALLSFKDQLMGWDVRSKAVHFALVDPLAREVEFLLGMPSGSLTTEFSVSPDTPCCVENVAHRERLAQQIDRMLATPTSNSTDHIIFVKNDSGTYGLGVYAFRSGAELRNANSTVLDKLSYARHGQRASGYVLQRGVKTSLFDADGRPIEVVLMTLYDEVYSYFVRIGELKSADSRSSGRLSSTGGKNGKQNPSRSSELACTSLNIPGAFFIKRKQFETDPQYAAASKLVRDNWDYYRVVGRLAALGMARERVWYGVQHGIAFGIGSSSRIGFDLLGRDIGANKRSLLGSLDVTKSSSLGVAKTNAQSNAVEPNLAAANASRRKSSRSEQKRSRARNNSDRSDNGDVSATTFDSHLRKLVGDAILRVSKKIEGMKAARVAKQRFATDLNHVRKQALEQARVGRRDEVLENCSARIGEMESTLLQDLGIQEEDDDVTQQSSTDVQLSQPSEELSSQSTPADASLTNGLAAKEQQAVKSQEQKSASSNDVDLELKVPRLTAKEVDETLRKVVCSMMQEVQDARAKTATAKLLQNVKKDFLKKTGSGLSDFSTKEEVERLFREEIASSSLGQ